MRSVRSHAHSSTKYERELTATGQTTVDVYEIKVLEHLRCASFASPMMYDQVE